METNDSAIVQAWSSTQAQPQIMTQAFSGSGRVMYYRRIREPQLMVRGKGHGASPLNH